MTKKPAPSVGKCAGCAERLTASVIWDKEAKTLSSDTAVNADAHLLMTPEKIWSMRMMRVRMKMTLQTLDTKADPRFQSKPHLLCRLKTKGNKKTLRCCRNKVVPGFRALYMTSQKATFRNCVGVHTVLKWKRMDGSRGDDFGCSCIFVVGCVENICFNAT